MDGPQIRGGIRRQGASKKTILQENILTFGFQVYCSDILDAITKDFFARKGGAMDETTHVTDIQVSVLFYSKKMLLLPITPPFTICLKVATFSDRPGYERTSSSLWKQREEYCAALIQKAWKDHQVKLFCTSGIGFRSSILFPFAGGEKKSAEVKEQAVCSKQEGEQWETDQSEECLRAFDLQFPSHL